MTIEYNSEYFERKRTERAMESWRTEEQSRVFQTTGGKTCCYRVFKESARKNEECGAPATHKAARASQMFYCEAHARHVAESGFRTVPIVDGYSSFEPRGRRFTNWRNRG